MSQGLHSSGNLAFVRDFETLQQMESEGRGMRNDNRDLVICSVDSWEKAAAYLVITSALPLSDRAVWRHVWDSQVELLITFLSETVKDDLALFSSSKFIGSYQLQLESEKEMGDYIVRTLKVRNRGCTRSLTQLVFMSWPPPTSGLAPGRSSLLSLVRESSQLQRTARGPGPVILWTPASLGPDPCVFWMCLDTMARMMRTSGDTNLSHYSRHLASRHGLSLSSPELYISLHDSLAWAIQHEKL